MKRFRDQPIGRKVTLLVLLASAVALSIAGLAVVVYEVSTVEPRVIQDLRGQGALLRANSVAALAFGDRDAAAENLATLRVRPEITAAALYDATGGLFAEYTRDATGNLSPPRRAPAGMSGRRGDQVRISQHIFVEGDRLGTLMMWYQLPSLATRMERYVVAAGLVMLTVAAVGATLLILLRQSVSRPILALADAARAVTQQRAYHVRVPKRADDELGQLTDAFNGMLSAIERSDEALRGNAAQLQEALEAARLARWSYDGAADRVSWGGAEARLFGDAPPGEPTLEGFLGAVDPDDRERVRARIAAALRDGRAIELDFRTRGADGKARWFYLRARVVEGAGARRIAGLVQDVTDRRRLEEQLQQSQKMEAIGRLAGGIAHDFNNLLTAILGYARFAQTRLDPDDPINDDIAEIQRAGERAARLTQQLLAYSRRQMLQPVVLDVNETVTAVSSLLGRLLGEHIELTLRLGPGAGTIVADRASLEQVIVNLAVNSRDAMPAGGQLTITTEPVVLGTERLDGLGHLPPGRYVRLGVTDTGHGMDAETRAQVFEPFFTTKEVGKGTGLGLAMVFGTVTQSGGGVTVESAPGRGATFSLYFPQVAQPAEDEPAAQPPAAGGRETVLVVEDEESVLALAARSLEEHGYEVESVASPRAALAWAADRDRIGAPPADLLVTDVVMPQLSGPELAAQLCARWAGLRVLFVSGYTDDAVVEHGLHEASVNFLAKPFNPEELARRVRAALDDVHPRGSRPTRVVAE